MNDNDHVYQVKQKIDGSEHQIAGRDINNQYIEEPLSSGNPNAIECRSCGKLISRKATVCPRCGHDFVAEYMAVQEKGRREWEDTKAYIGIALIVTIFGAVQITSRTRLDFTESLILMVILLGCLWYGWIWLSVQYETWLARRKKR